MLGLPKKYKKKNHSLLRYIKILDTDQVGIGDFPINQLFNDNQHLAENSSPTRPETLQSDTLNDSHTQSVQLYAQPRHGNLDHISDKLRSTAEQSAEITVIPDESDIQHIHPLESKIVQMSIVQQTDGSLHKPHIKITPQHVASLPICIEK